MIEVLVHFPNLSLSFSQINFIFPEHEEKGKEIHLFLGII